MIEGTFLQSKYKYLYILYMYILVLTITEILSTMPAIDDAPWPFGQGDTPLAQLSASMPWNPQSLGFNKTIPHYKPTFVFTQVFCYLKNFKNGFASFLEFHCRA